MGYPSRAEWVLVFHSRAANFVLGLSEVQMNRDQAYDGSVANQLETLEHIGLFAEPLPKSAPEQLAKNWSTPPIRGPAYDWRESSLPALELHQLPRRGRRGRRRGQPERHYLEGRDEGRRGHPHAGDLRDRESKDRQPRTPRGHRHLWSRVNLRGQGQMPPLASSIVNESAVKLLREWIEQIPPIARSAE